MIARCTPATTHQFEVRHVPGHSPGHVAFVAPGIIVGGDVLFAGSIGRTDLPGGDMVELEASIRKEFYTLPDDTRVLTGHGAETTIGAERRSNPFVRG
jgi:glyoxylase-like metal-dependent hydrolase (beta-lactamase superfamily II)